MASPIDPSTALMNARSMLQKRRPDDAVKMLRRAGKGIERLAPAQHTLASAYMMMGKPADAARAAKKASSLDPKNIEYRMDLARALSQSGDDTGAIRALEPVEPSNAAFSQARRMIAKMRMDLGEYDLAREAIEPVLADERFAEDAVLTLSLARLALAPGIDGLREQAAARLERIVADADQPDRTRADAHQNLARLHDAEGRYETAFEHADRFNELVRQEWDPDEFSRRVSAMLEAWSPEVWAATHRAPETQGQKQIFVLGMPRSGTSLVEQMLAAHADVFAGGERHELSRIAFELQPPIGDEKHMLDQPARFTQANVTNAGMAYVESMRTVRASSSKKRARRVVDKMPYNFLYLPLIRASMPSATIIHTVRDPLDVGVSNYTHLFVGDHRFSTRLDWLGRFIADYERIAEHFESLEGMNTHRVPYESLVSEPEAAGRAMFDAAGLDWTDDVLSFHATGGASATASIDQVRRPVHASRVGRAERYGTLLDPLRDALHEGRQR